jgi:molybdopterin-guanine dinucleotide biosynthesis protein A
VDKPAGVILAGGRSSRMGVAHKALLELNGQPLLAHVIERLQSQADPLLLSCESDALEFESFGLSIVPDLLPDHRGPLTGLCSALQHTVAEGRNNGLVLCPCDAPFIPDNLVQSLLEAYRGDRKSVVLISYQGVLQPTFSLWQNHHLPVIREAVVGKGMGGLKQVLPLLPHSIVEWVATEPSPFFNINTPAELKSATQWLDHMQL